MAPDRRKPQPGAADDHSSDHSLVDAYHRPESTGSRGGHAFVLIFGDRAHQFHFEQGDSQGFVAARLRDFADKLAEES